MSSEVKATIPEAEEYIFSIFCRPRNTDSEKSTEGHWEYFYYPSSSGYRYSYTGCDFYPWNNIGGVAYGYGQNDTPYGFENDIIGGKGAGNHTVHYNRWGNWIDTWATGVDCSGFVCSIWNGKTGRR